EEAEFASASEVAHTVYEFCETALEIAIDDVYENIDEFVVEEGEEKAKGKAEARKEGATRIKQAPQLAAGVSASIAVPFGTSLASTGLAVIASSVFGAAVKPASIAKEIRAHQVTAANIDKIAAILGDGIEKAMSNIDPNQGGSTAEIKTAVSGARAAIKANITDQSAELVKFLNKGNVEQLLAAAAKAGAGISDAIGKQP